MSNVRLRRFLTCFAVTVCIACGGDGPGLTDPPDEEPVDTAAVNAAARLATTNAALAQLEDAINALAEALSKGGVPGAGGPSTGIGAGVSSGPTATLAAAPPDAAKCTFDDATMRHVCPDVTQSNGVIVNTWFQFLDAAAAPHKDPDSSKTVAIRRVVNKRGKMATQHTSQAGTVPATQTIDVSDTLVLSGLQGPIADRVLNSKGLMTVLLEPEGQPSVAMEVPIAADNLKLTPPGPAGSPKPPSYPIAGKVTASVTAKRADLAQSSTTIQVTTYDGNTATLVITASQTGQVVRTCTWDQSSKVPPVCQVP